jgi:hypothetical protein
MYPARPRRPGAGSAEWRPVRDRVGQRGAAEPESEAGGKSAPRNIATGTFRARRSVKDSDSRLRMEASPEVGRGVRP